MSSQQKENTADHSNEQVRDKVSYAFSATYYLSRYPDIQQSGEDPLTHYLTSGWQEGRDPSAAFSTRFYMESNQGVDWSVIHPFYHYITTGLQEGRRPVPIPDVYIDERQYEFTMSVIRQEFDENFYREQYPDFQGQMLDAVEHFLLIGCTNNLDPAPWFSVNDYLSMYDDVRDSGTNPFYHYLVLGRMEGRQPVRRVKKAGDSPSVSSEELRLVAEELDREYYLTMNPDVVAAGMDPVEHYITSGWNEGRDPSPDFSTSYYLQANPDVREKGMNPLYHYALRGRQEGRLPDIPGGHVAKSLYNLKTIEEQLDDWTPPDEAELDIIDAATLRAGLEEVTGDNCKRLVVSLSHDDYTVSVGGVQYCVTLEQQAFNRASATYLNINPVRPIPVLAREQDMSLPTLSLLCNGKPLGVVSAAVCLEVLAECRGRVGSIDLVVHALLGHSTDFVLALAGTVINGESIYWIHDYQSLCTGYNLLRNGVSYCGVPKMGSMACSICIYGDERIEQHRFMQELFETLPFRVVAPSGFSADLWKQHCDFSYSELVVCPHTVFERRNEEEAVNDMDDEIDGESVLRVAFAGYTKLHKGWPVFRKLVSTYHNDPTIEFHHLCTSPANEVVGLNYTPVSVTGDNPGAMINALIENRIDLVIVWSVWPETYCLTAYEAAAAGVPVLTNEDSGNVARMVMEHDCGFVLRDESELFETFSSGEIHQKVAALQERKGKVRMVLSYSNMSAGLILSNGDR